MKAPFRESLWVQKTFLLHCDETSPLLSVISLDLMVPITLGLSNLLEISFAFAGVPGSPCNDDSEQLDAVKHRNKRDMTKKQILDIVLYILHLKIITQI